MTLVGNNGANILTGTAQTDTLIGNGGADNMMGGGGNDLFLLGATAEFAVGERVTGGDGIDTLRYTGNAPTTLTLTTLVTTIEQVQIADAGGDGSGTAAINVNAAAVVNGLAITGNAGNNVLTGTSQGDTIFGGGGNDTLNSVAGADEVDGGLGADTINLSGFAAADTVIYNALNEGAAAGANTGFDTVSGFQTGMDKVRFASNANTALDDITADDILAFATDAAPDFTTTNEALLRTGVADAALTELDFAALLSNLNTLSVTAGAGDDGLIVAQGAAQTGIYYYLEDGTVANNISASELALLAIVNGQLGTGEFDLF
jgi:Ca2+-binding RTX toxin-like protein